MTKPTQPPEVNWSIPTELTATHGISPIVPAMQELTFAKFVEQQVGEINRSLGIPAHVFASEHA